MNGSIRRRTWCIDPVSVAVALGCLVLLAGQAKSPHALGAEPPANGPYRQLAPGVMLSADPALREAETVSRHDVVELLAADPNLDWAKDVPFRRKIWHLEFKFKPMRLILVDVPHSDGRLQQKLIWYLVYSVTNTGKVMPSIKGAGEDYQLQDSNQPILFVPEFRLRSHEFGKEYPDRVIPIAIGPIRMREDPKRKFYNSVDMSAEGEEIQPGQTKWGVATWESVDPKIDRFSVYVNGLTNAYRWQDPKGAYKVGDPLGKGRQWIRKTLKLNFWRPGDEYYEHEKEFRFGIPGEVDYEWVYR
jgi:hypothetical protein